MRCSILLLLPLVSLVFVGAPSAQNRFGPFPGDQDDAVTRPSGLVDGDVLNAVRKEDFRYVGNSTTTSMPAVPAVRITGFMVNIQDQEASTQENYDFVIVPEDPANAGQPNPGANTELVVSTLLSPPGATGVAAWFIQATFTTPFEDPSLTESTWFYGARVRANPAWTNDGISIAMASYYGLGGNFPPTHDNPSLSAINLGWEIDRVNGTVSQSGTPRVYHVKLLTDAATCQVGQDVVSSAQTGINPMFGAGGIWPDNKGQRTLPAYANRGGVGDGIVFRVRDESTDGGIAVILVSSGFTPIPGVTIPNVNGSVPLDFTSSLFLQLPAAMGTLAPQQYFPGNVVPFLTQTETIIRPGYLGQGSLMQVPSATLVFSSVSADFSSGIVNLANAAAVHLE